MWQILSKDISGNSKSRHANAKCVDRLAHPPLPAFDFTGDTVGVTVFESEKGKRSILSLLHSGS